MEPFDSFDEFEETKKILTPLVEETVQVIDQVSDQVEEAPVEETPIPVEEPAVEADPAPKRGRKKKEV